MKLSGETKLFVGILVITIIIIVAAVLFFSKPAVKITREDLLISTTKTQGTSNSQTYLIEFSDFQCPACKTYQPLVAKIVDNYKHKMIFGYRHFPLNQHPFAQKAAYAAEAAAEQGKFWEMHDFLFENQEKLSDEIIKEGVQKLDLDTKKFEENFQSETIRNRVTKDLSDGTRFGVNATPTFFLNGEKLEISNREDLENAVKKAIGQ